ncbi:Prokaryotic membrane lipoprotein lipid [Echinococcus multilocularis]|uniref:Prokaryotic membrane lipoprotein lipid n=1 Tax=Echinococcus multilocularis TaxID=6211 RepID=A0A087W0Y8_ECHMU|nr:Prokaryotic membrane lipoprotein lipid [Echinococcus multilocularis]
MAKKQKRIQPYITAVYLQWLPGVLTSCHRDLMLLNKELPSPAFFSNVLHYDTGGGHNFTRTSFTIQLTKTGHFTKLLAIRYLAEL